MKYTIFFPVQFYKNLRVQVEKRFSSFRCVLKLIPMSARDVCHSYICSLDIKPCRRYFKTMRLDDNAPCKPFQNWPI